MLAVPVGHTTCHIILSLVGTSIVLYQAANMLGILKSIGISSAEDENDLEIHPNVIK